MEGIPPELIPHFLQNKQATLISTPTTFLQEQTFVSSTYIAQATTYTNPDGSYFAASENYQEKKYIIPGDGTVEGFTDLEGQQGPCTNGVPVDHTFTFQYDDFTFLNDISETPNPSHTIEGYTWCYDNTVTTCEREAGATEMGHVDTTLGESSGDRTSTSNLLTETVEMNGMPALRSHRDHDPLVKTTRTTTSSEVEITSTNYMHSPTMSYEEHFEDIEDSSYVKPPGWKSVVALLAFVLFLGLG